jgi:hypothetical protein
MLDAFFVAAVLEGSKARSAKWSSGWSAPKSGSGWTYSTARSPHCGGLSRNPKEQIHVAPLAGELKQLCDETVAYAVNAASIAEQQPL